MARGHRSPAALAAIALLLSLALPIGLAPARADERLTFTPDATSTQLAATANSGSRWIVVYLEKVGGVERCYYQIADTSTGDPGTPQVVPLLPGFTAQDRPTVAVDENGAFVISCQNTRTNAQATSQSVVPPGQGVALPPTQIVAATDTNPATQNAGSFNEAVLVTDSSPSSPFHGNTYLFSTLNFVNFPNSGSIRLHRRLPNGTWPLTSTVISGTPNFNGQPYPYVGRNGRLYVAWYDSFQRDKIWFSSSTDGGTTWGPQSLVGFSDRHPDYGTGSTAFACPHSSGLVQLLFGDGSVRPYRVKRTVSTDGGTTWSPATDIAPSGGDQFLPGVDCDETTGRTDVAYYQAIGEGNLANIHLTQSTDGGQTWSPPTPVNDVSIDPAAVKAATGNIYLPLLRKDSSIVAPLQVNRAVVPGTDVFPLWTAPTSLGNTDVYTAGTPAGAVSLVAAVLPASRSVQVGALATLFVTVINTGTATATQVGIRLLTAVPATFSYQTTDANNLPTGTPNTPVDIPPGQGRTFLIVLTPTAAFPPSDILLGFAGTNTAGVRTIVGVNTYLQAASASAVADLIMLTATVGGGGIADVPVGGFAAFAMATVNVGAGDTLTISADTGDANLPVSVLVCRTVAAICVADPAASVTDVIGPNETPTYSFFAAASAAVAFDPARNRLVISAREPGGALRGRTSLAVRTP